MEVDLKSLFGLHFLSRDVHSCTHWLRPCNSPQKKFQKSGSNWSCKPDEVKIKVMFGFSKRDQIGRISPFSTRTRARICKPRSRLFRGIDSAAYMLADRLSHRPASQHRPVGIDSLESTSGLNKRLQIRALYRL
jgi:hypothetical protein